MKIIGFKPLCPLGCLSKTRLSIIASLLFCTNGGTCVWHSHGHSVTSQTPGKTQTFKRGPSACQASRPEHLARLREETERADTTQIASRSDPRRNSSGQPWPPWDLYGQGLAQSLPGLAPHRLCPYTALGHIKWPMVHLARGCPGGPMAAFVLDTPN